MSVENEAYAEGARLLRELGALRTEIQNINASDTACKERALQLLEQSRARLREALTELSGLV
jgi:hypothetical protein